MDVIKPSKGNKLLVANWESDVGYAWWLMESFWAEIATLFAKNGKQTFLAYPVINTIPASIQAAPITPIQLNARPNQMTLKEAWQLVRTIKSHGIQHIYFTDQPYIHWLYPILRLAGVERIIVHDHTPGERIPPKGIKQKIKWLMARLPWFTADKLIAVTDYVRKRHVHINRAPRSRCTVAPNGIVPIASPAETSHTLLETLQLPPNAIIAITVGRASHYKGISTIIQACRDVVLEHGWKDFHVIHCGDGPDIEAFRQETRDSGIAPHFHFAGKRDDVRSLLPHCHIGIQASKGEVGYSLSILEYMSAGLATVVPDNPSVNGAITSGMDGLLYTPQTSPALAEALCRLLEDPAYRNRLGNNARTKVVERFTLENTHDALRRIIKESCLG